MEEVCIIASTPFQILSACAITEQYRDFSFDLYIIGNFKGYKELATKLSAKSIFKNIYTYQIKDVRLFFEKKSSILRHVGAGISYLFPQKGVKEILPNNKQYGVVFFAAAHSALELILFAKKKWKSKFIMYDDGVMTYRNPKHCLAENGYTKYIKKIAEFFVGRIDPVLLLYMPELFEKLNGNGFIVKKLRSISDEKKELVKTLFDITSADSIDEKIIIIECKVDDYLNNEENKKLETIYELISCYNKCELIFKRHPRDTRPLLSTRKYILKNVPFEAINYIQDMNTKIMIAWDSTSCITPKLFFDQEPRVILLYKLVNGKIDNLAETDRFYTEFKNSYKECDRFQIPTNEEELRKCLSKFD